MENLVSTHGSNLLPLFSLFIHMILQFYLKRLFRFLSSNFFCGSKPDRVGWYCVKSIKIFKYKSTIFKRNSIFKPGSNYQVENNKFHFDSCIQEPYPDTETFSVQKFSKTCEVWRSVHSYTMLEVIVLWHVLWHDAIKHLFTVVLIK